MRRLETPDRAAQGAWATVSAMTTVQQQRKGVFRLMFVALAVFLVTLATRKDEPEPPPELPDQPGEVVGVKPARTVALTWAPGERVAVPPRELGGDAETCVHSWWMKDPLLSDVRIEADDQGAWVIDHLEVPESVLDCLGSALRLDPGESVVLPVGG